MSRIVNRSRWLGALLLTALVGCAPSPSRDAPLPESFHIPENFRLPRIELNTSGPQATIEVTGLSERQLAEIGKLDVEQQSAIFHVCVASDASDVPPLGGEITVDEGRLRSTPRHPLRPGLGYRVQLKVGLPPGDKEGLPVDLASAFLLPKPADQPPAVVEHIYPTTDRLPENQLKFYLHFSAPMGRGEAYRHIHLLDASGQEVEAPFLELGEELWDTAMRRFTLLCDPGRVKRGLKPREELGPVLEEGKSYTLVIDRDWPDATGADLTDATRKEFQVMPPDDTPIDPKAWKIEPPPAGTIEPLVVRFGEPLDHSLLERVVWITNPAGEKLVGAIETSDDETCWRFKPEQAWSAGEYQLVANTLLEDLAGNAIGRPFDVDVFGPIQKTIETETVSIPFTIGLDTTN